MRFQKITGILLLLSCCAWAGIIQNPSFETPVMPADSYTYRPIASTGVVWTFTGSAGIASNGSPFGLGLPDDNPYNNMAPDGSQVAFIQFDTGNQNSHPGNVTQYITGLSPSTLYTLSFDAAQRPETDGPNGFLFGGGIDVVVYWCPLNANCSQIDFVDFYSQPSTSLTFAPYSPTFTTMTGVTYGSLQFQAYDAEGQTGDRAALIDDVQLIGGNTPTSTPEPSNGLMVLSGVGLIGLGLRRRLVHSRSLPS